ncbi:uncharacterized protein I303_106275 [Kwoniella dejecticola CBS 10117]|uniref:Uncharacterized protein n=1 Tax=Kwoniella dejecticola CBS 10117 TaxID=1296121 RepID=A0AAJ8KU75_9TREE
MSDQPPKAASKDLIKERADLDETHQSKSNRQARKVIDYTKLFLPLNEWTSVREKNSDSFFYALDEQGRCRLQRTMSKSGLKFLPSWRSYEGKKLMRKIGVDFDDEVSCSNSSWRSRRLNPTQFGMIRRYDPGLSFPARGDYSFGYSWPAWRKAASYAGAKEPPYSMSTVLTVAKNALDYHCTLLRTWQNEPAIFAADLNVILDNTDIKKVASEIIIRARSRGKIATRLSNLYQDIILWQKIVEGLESIISCGINFRGRQSFLRVTSRQDIQDTYGHTFLYLTYLLRKQVTTLDEAFWEGKGESFATETREETTWSVKIRDLKDLLRLSLEPTRFVVKKDLRELKRDDYLNYVVAQLSGRASFALSDCSLTDYDHHVLAYEQAMKEDPASTSKIAGFVQLLIGELIMTIDVSEAFRALLHGSDTQSERELSLPAFPVHAGDLSEISLILDRARKIFSEPFPDSDILYRDGKMTEKGCSMLWEHWNSTSDRFYNLTVNDLFEVNDLLKPPSPRWDPTFDSQTSIDDLPRSIEAAFSIEENLPYAQSGHKFFTAHHAGLNIGERSTIDSDIKLNVGEDVPAQSVHSAPPDAAAKHDLIKPFQVTNKQFRLVKRLFSDTGDGQGQVRYVDIEKLLSRIGFEIEECGGSIVRFTPPNNAGFPFNDHRPHPEKTINALRHRAFGKLLTERYGWDETWFARAAETGQY